MSQETKASALWWGLRVGAKSAPPPPGPRDTQSDGLGVDRYAPTQEERCHEDQARAAQPAFHHRLGPEPHALTAVTR